MTQIDSRLRGSYYRLWSCEIINLVASVHLGLWDLCCALSQRYRTTLCSTNLLCAAPTCVAHHGAQGGPTVRSTMYTLGVHNIALYWLGGVDFLILDSKRFLLLQVVHRIILEFRYQLWLWCCTIRCCQSSWVCGTYIVEATFCIIKCSSWRVFKIFLAIDLLLIWVFYPYP